MPGVPMASQGSSLGDPKRVLSLMTKPLSVDLLARHLVSIKHLCHENSTGCTLQSLPELTQILEIVLRSTRAQPDSQLTGATCDLLRYLAYCLWYTSGSCPCWSFLVADGCRALSRPFKRVQVSDDIRFVKHIAKLLSVVGQCLQAGVPVAVQCRAAVVRTFLAFEYSRSCRHHACKCLGQIRRNLSL